jgi:GH24 family phage-related lysozyme (muramidase)
VHRETLLAQIRIAEGLRLKVYPDTLDHATVGYGHKLVPEDNLEPGGRITHARATFLLEQDVYKAVNAAQAFCSLWATLPEPVQHVVCEMAFNLGRAGLFKCHKLRAALAVRDFGRAGEEIRNSLAYRQLPKRYERLARVVDSYAETPQTRV